MTKLAVLIALVGSIIACSSSTPTPMSQEQQIKHEIHSNAVYCSEWTTPTFPRLAEMCVEAIERILPYSANELCAIASTDATYALNNYRALTDYLSRSGQKEAADKLNELADKLCEDSEKGE